MDRPTRQRGWRDVERGRRMVTRLHVAFALGVACAACHLLAGVEEGILRPEGGAGGDERREGRGDRAHVLRGRREHHQLGFAHRCHVGGGADPRDQGDVLQEKRVGGVAVDGAHHLRLARPQVDAVPDAPQHAPHRRAECPAAHDADPRHGAIV